MPWQHLGPGAGPVQPPASWSAQRHHRDWSPDLNRLASIQASNLVRSFAPMKTAELAGLPSPCAFQPVVQRHRRSRKKMAAGGRRLFARIGFRTGLVVVVPRDTPHEDVPRGRGCTTRGSAGGSPFSPTGASTGASRGIEASCSQLRHMPVLVAIESPETFYSRLLSTPHHRKRRFGGSQLSIPA